MKYKVEFEQSVFLPHRPVHVEADEFYIEDGMIELLLNNEKVALFPVDSIFAIYRDDGEQ